MEPALSEDGQPPKAAVPAEGAVVPEPSPPPPAKLEETSDETRVVSDETRVVAVGDETGAEASPREQPAGADGSGPATTIREEGQPSAGDEAEEKGTGADVEAGEDTGPPVDTDSSLASELSLQTKKPTPHRPG